MMIKIFLSAPDGVTHLNFRSSVSKSAISTCKMIEIECHIILMGNGPGIFLITYQNKDIEFYSTGYLITRILVEWHIVQKTFGKCD